MARVEKDTSRYANTPDVDFYLDLWVTKNVEVSVNDQLMEVEPRYHLRPDMMSYDLYGTPKYWWIFAILNKDKLVDPINDFVSGITVYVPTRDRIEAEFLNV